jgi:hypothetical protein
MLIVSPDFQKGLSRMSKHSSRNFIGFALILGLLAVVTSPGLSILADDPTPCPDGALTVATYVPPSGNNGNGNGNANTEDPCADSATSGKSGGDTSGAGGGNSTPPPSSSEGVTEGGLPDTDGDSLPDDWEINGHNGITLVGANPMRKDIYVEMDYMTRATATNGLGPNASVISRIVAVFAAAPVSNPDGSTGITLHLEVGNEVTYDADLYPYLTEFNNIKAANFNSAKASMYRYMVWANGHSGGTSSGVAMGIPHTDFVVTLGKWNTNAGGTDDQKVGTFIHELGHTIGLRHGGNDDKNNKPNYFSVMNYRFQTIGVYRNGAWGNFDYQRFAVPNIDETKLNEPNGINAGGVLAGYKTVIVCPKGTNAEVDAGGPINWNCDTDTTDASVRSDTNADGTRGVLGSQNNWASIVFTGGGVIGSGESAEALIEKGKKNQQNIGDQELTEERMKLLLPPGLAKKQD